MKKADYQAKIEELEEKIEEQARELEYAWDENRSLHKTLDNLGGSGSEASAVWRGKLAAPVVEFIEETRPDLLLDLREFAEKLGVA